MTEDEFQTLLRINGYGEPKSQTFAPTIDSDLHTHEFSAMLLVTEGEFTLLYENGSKTFTAGQHCEVPVGTVHTERAGADGAKVLAATK